MSCCVTSWASAGQESAGDARWHSPCSRLALEVRSRREPRTISELGLCKDMESGIKQLFDWTEAYKSGKILHIKYINIYIYACPKDLSVTVHFPLTSLHKADCKKLIWGMSNFSSKQMKQNGMQMILITINLLHLFFSDDKSALLLLKHSSY